MYTTILVVYCFNCFHNCRSQSPDICTSTMSAVEVKKAQNNLTCPVCYQLFRSPKYLPCYHSYCEGCLEKMQVQSRIICPECRKEAKVPAGGVKELATNFFINRLVDDLILKKKVDGEQEVKCDECDEDDPVVSFCPECNSFLCYACNDHHKRNKRYRGHAVVPLTELKSNKDASIQAKLKIPLCKEHDEQLKYYCETCDELVCMYCTVKKHNGHHHDSVKQMATKHRNELKKITDPVEGMIKNLSEAHDNIKKMKKKIRRRGEEVDKKIDRYYDELLQKLMKQKEEVKQQARDAVSQKEKAVTTQMEEVASMQAELMSMKELTDALEQSSDQEALSTKKQVTDRVQQLTNKYSKLNIEPVKSATMDFLPTKEPFPVFGHLFAYVDPHTSEVINLMQHTTVGKKVEFTIMTKYRNGCPCISGGSQVCVQLKSFTGNVTAGEVRDNDDGSYMASFVAEQVGEAKLSVSINGEQIKGSPYNIVVRNYQAIDKPSKIVNNNGSMGEPWGVACSKNGLWAVADRSNYCVYIFDDKNQLVRKFGSYGSNNGQFRGLSGIAFDSHNHLYVVENGNHRVQKIDTTGNYLLQFGSRGSSAGQLDHPLGIAIHNDMVYIADNCNKRVSVFQTNGQFYNIFGSDVLGYLWNVGISADKYLVVAGINPDCIYTFTLDGHYIGKFGTKGSGRCEFNNPCGITGDLNGFIIVADTYNHRVSIFDKDGNCIHCFGSCGSANGQFNSPFGIALSPDGNIYVSDNGNNRIQIFSNY